MERRKAPMLIAKRGVNVLPAVWLYRTGWDTEHTAKVEISRLRELI
jgi:hypothetical protein